MLAMMGHHGWVLHALIALVISTAFLVWLGGKEGVPCVKFAKVIAWIAIVITGLMVIGGIFTCATTCSKYGWPCMRGGMMMEKGGMPMGPMMMHPGMKMGPGPMAMPPPPEEKK